MSSTNSFHDRALAWLANQHGYAPDPAAPSLRVDPDRPSYARSNGTRALAANERRDVHIPVISLFACAAIAAFVSIRAGVAVEVIAIARIAAVVCLVLGIGLVLIAARSSRAAIHVVLVAARGKENVPLDLGSIGPYVEGTHRSTWVVAEAGFTTDVLARFGGDELRWFAEQRRAFVEVTAGRGLASRRRPAAHRRGES